MGTQHFLHDNKRTQNGTTLIVFREKGLYTEVFDSTEEMDKEVYKLAKILSKSSPESMMRLKKIIWQGTEHWDKLLIERAIASGTLVLSDFSKNAINKLKQ